MTKLPQRSVPLAGYPLPNDETPWILDALRELERATYEWSNNDVAFAASYNAQSVKAAALFSRRITPGPATLGYAINVSAVNRVTAGTYSLMFETPLSSANYLIQWSVEWASGAGIHVQIVAKTVNGFILMFKTDAGVAADPGADVHVTVMGAA